MKKDVIHALESIPGLEFNPTDEVLLQFLKRKKEGAGQCYDEDMIATVDFNSVEPDQLHEHCGFKGDKLFFFTQRKMKHENGVRPNRCTATGRWKDTTGEKNVFDGQNRLIGVKKTLTYAGDELPEWKKGWIMQEYVLMEDSQPSKKVRKLAAGGVRDEQRLTDWAVCKVYHHKVEAKKPRKIKHRVEKKKREKSSQQVVDNPCDESAAAPLKELASLHRNIDDDPHPLAIMKSDLPVAATWHARGGAAASDILPDWSAYIDISLDRSLPSTDGDQQLLPDNNFLEDLDDDDGVEICLPMSSPEDLQHGGTSTSFPTADPPKLELLPHIHDTVSDDFFLDDLDLSSLLPMSSPEFLVDDYLKMDDHINNNPEANDNGLRMTRAPPALHDCEFLGHEDHLDDSLFDTSWDPELEMDVQELHDILEKMRMRGRRAENLKL